MLVCVVFEYVDGAVAEQKFRKKKETNGCVLRALAGSTRFPLQMNSGFISIKSLCPSSMCKDVVNVGQRNGTVGQ